MPSKSYAIYQELLTDVDALILVHQTLSKGKKGRKYLGHLTRSGVVMLCAAWETYIESLLLECVSIVLNEIPDARLLPKEVQKNLSQFVKNHKHDLMPMEMTGDGWKKVLQDLAMEKTGRLNTPKSRMIDPIFEEFLGLVGFSQFWKSFTAAKIDDFISVRGEIAHKGGGAKYVRLQQLKDYFAMISETVIEADGHVAQYLSGTLLPSGKTPWNLTY